MVPARGLPAPVSRLHLRTFRFNFTPGWPRVPPADRACHTAGKLYGPCISMRQPPCGKRRYRNILALAWYAWSVRAGACGSRTARSTRLYANLKSHLGLLYDTYSGSEGSTLTSTGTKSIFRSGTRHAVLNVKFMQHAGLVVPSLPANHGKRIRHSQELKMCRTATILVRTLVMKDEDTLTVKPSLMPTATVSRPFDPPTTQRHDVPRRCKVFSESILETIVHMSPPPPFAYWHDVVTRGSSGLKV